MAIKALMSPFIKARITNGLDMKILVAPTICIVLIKKRLLNIARRMVLSILIITMTHKMTERTKKIRPTLVARSFKLVTKLFGY